MMEPAAKKHKCDENEDSAELQSQLLARLYRFADPTPNLQEFWEGISHYNKDPVNANALFDLVRAIASRQMHYFTKIKGDGSFPAPHEVPRPVLWRVDWCAIRRLMEEA